MLYTLRLLIAMQCTNDLLSLQQYMFNVCSIVGTVVADLFYIVYYYYRTFLIILCCMVTQIA